MRQQQRQHLVGLDHARGAVYARQLRRVQQCCLQQAMPAATYTAAAASPVYAVAAWSSLYVHYVCHILWFWCVGVQAAQCDSSSSGTSPNQVNHAAHASAIPTVFPACSCAGAEDASVA